MKKYSSILFARSINLIKQPIIRFSVVLLSGFFTSCEVPTESYEKSLISINSVNVGDLFASSSEPVFIFEDNPEEGKLDIYTSFLGSDSATISGTGSIATLVLGTLTSGTSILSYTSDSEFVDENDNLLELNGFGEGEIVAQ